MANISKYVYQKLITLNGNRAYLYKNNNVIYSVMSLKNDNNEEWLDLYSSSDDGETWSLDSDLPISAYPLYDAKFIIVGSTWYIFAHGINGASIDTTFYIKKTTDSDNKMTWDSKWTELFTNIVFNNRVTDICTDDNGSFIHLMLDQINYNNKYAVRYVLFSTTDYTVKLNQLINNIPSVNQHNGRMKLLSGDTISVTWTQENYNGLSQIYYAQYNYINSEWSNILKLSDDDSHNNYHQSMTKDSDNTIHIVWLNTQDSYATDNIKYTSIVDMSQKDVSVISDKAQSDKYPYILCDENDGLYILYNLADNYVQYMVKRVTDNKWKEVVNLSENNWQLLYGYCVDKNLYTIVLQGNKSFFVRIDTDMAEIFEPINDLQVAYVTNSNIGFAWTAVRNAEEIYLEELKEDTWLDATVITPTLITDDNAEAIALPAGKYKFRIKYIDNKGIENVLYLDGQYTNTSKQNIKVKWTPPTNITEQKLQYSVESWRTLAQIPCKDYYYECNFDGRITDFRLRVVGGIAEGYSNIVRPLIISLNNNKDILLTWSKIVNCNYLEIQQSIDGTNWYTATLQEAISVNSESAIINKLNSVTYRYRLHYLLDNKEQFSNWVSATTDLECTNYTYDSIYLQWTSIDSTETHRFQYSIDNGLNWTTSINPIKNCTTIIPKLKYDTTYLVRMYFPNRFTGIYSNVISVTTNKKPIDDLVLIKHDNTTADFKFTIMESYSDVTIKLIDAVTKEETEVLLSKCNPVVTPLNLQTNSVEFTVNNLKKGTYYKIYAIPLNSSYGGLSNMVEIVTTGDSPQNLKCISQDIHSVNLTWDKLDRITTDNISAYVYVSYTYDGLNWTEIAVNELVKNTYTLTNLMQETDYKVKVICLYGDNYGESDIITVTTKAGYFKPVYGLRLPNERNFIKNPNDGLFYIFDMGKLYTYNETTKEQKLEIDYNISANHVYSSIDIDKNGYIHLVFCCGKEVFYCTNCKEKLEDGTIKEHILSDKNLIVKDDFVNEFLNPYLKINNNNNLIIIVWEEDCGYYSNISMIKYRNGNKFSDKSVLISDKLYNHAPKIALKNAGGYYIACVNDNSCINIIESTMDNDYTSTSYLTETISTQQIAITNPFTAYFNNFDIVADNLDGLRIFYDSITDNAKTSTYSTYIDDKYKQMNVFGQNMQDSKIIANKYLIMIGRSDTTIYSAKYSNSQGAFTDLMDMNLDAVDTNPLCLSYDKNNVYILSFKNGEFLIQTKVLKDISDGNNYVNGTWIDNQFGIQNDDEDYIVKIWTNGDINNYPSMYLQCNKLVHEITLLDEFGYRINKSIKVNSLTNLDLTNEETKTKYASYITDNTKSLIEIIYNTDKSIVVDLTNMLYYSWDLSKVANSASK